MGLPAADVPMVRGPRDRSVSKWGKAGRSQLGSRKRVGSECGPVVREELCQGTTVPVDTRLAASGSGSFSQR